MSAIDWPALRAHRSPLWRPGMNTQFEPWVALAEVNTGHAMVPCGRNADRAREVVARWHVMAQRGTPFDGIGSQICYGAAVITPRGDIEQAWKLPDVGSVPDPLGAPRWASLRAASSWVSCMACQARRWPGCYVGVLNTGCSQCLPATESADPRTWPVEPPCPGRDPDTVKKTVKRKR